MPDRETLREAVEAQARALVAGDLATFASFATPQALPPMYRAPRAGSASSYDIVDIEAAGDGQGRSAVRFRGPSSYVMRADWQRTSSGWKAVALEIPPEAVRASWWRRMLRLGPDTQPAARREDLS
ncbi:MAG: hypothetical protein HY873_08420 [Chloroflexi bacterium]|nr:hypothetical protein [Chloroflexota bacterium]